jgi:hypothetical protein
VSGAFAVALIALIVVGVWLRRERPGEAPPAAAAHEEGRKTPAAALSSVPERPAAAGALRPADQKPKRVRSELAARQEGAASADDDEPSEERIEVIEAWEGFIDAVAERETAPTAEQAIQFKREFQKLDKRDRMDGVQTALNLLPDEQFSLLYPILFDKTEDPDVLDAIFSDGLNHDDDIKVPMMKEIYQDKEHPMYAEAARILDATGELDEPDADEPDAGE